MSQASQPFTRGVVESAYSERQLSIKWAVSTKTLQSWRLTGGGPRFVKLGKAVRYLQADVINFESKNKFDSTSQQAESLKTLDQSGQI